jgi:chromosome segregation ATPase
MTPEQSESARAAARSAGSLFIALSTTEVLPKALCSLAQSCLMVASVPRRWPESHEYVRDHRSIKWRESLARQCAEISLLLSEGLRDLSAHGNAAVGELDLSTRAAALADALAQATAGLLKCEEALRERLDHPRFAEITLVNRVQLLQSTPQVSGEEIRRLSREIEGLDSARARGETDYAELNRRTSDARESLGTLERRRDELKEKLESTNADVLECERAYARLEIECESRRRDLVVARANRTRIEAQLKQLSSDPRAEIVAAVNRAMRELPADQFDRVHRGSP